MKYLWQHRDSRGGIKPIRLLFRIIVLRNKHMREQYGNPVILDKEGHITIPDLRVRLREIRRTADLLPRFNLVGYHG